MFYPIDTSFNKNFFVIVKCSNTNSNPRWNFHDSSNRFVTCCVFLKFYFKYVGCGNKFLSLFKQHSFTMYVIIFKVIRSKCLSLNPITFSHLLGNKPIPRRKNSGSCVSILSSSNFFDTFVRIETFPRKGWLHELEQMEIWRSNIWRIRWLEQNFSVHLLQVFFDRFYNVRLDIVV